MTDWMRDIAETRHPGVGAVAQWFEYDHLPAGLPRDLSANCASLARYMLASLPDSPELTTGLRKLLEAKDCLVRAAIAAQRAQAAPDDEYRLTPPGKARADAEADDPDSGPWDNSGRPATQDIL